MKANISLVAALAIMTAPALAQDPSPAPAPQENAPSVQTDQMSPSTPSAPSATEPAPATPPATDTQAAAPAPSAATNVSGLRKTEDDNKMVAPLNASVDAVEDMDVFDATGKKIAEVDAVLEDSNGEVKGVAIEYGGFLGFGEKGAILTIDQVRQKDGNIAIDMTEEQLSTLPAWND